MEQPSPADSNGSQKIGAGQGIAPQPVYRLEIAREADRPSQRSSSLTPPSAQSAAEKRFGSFCVPISGITTGMRESPYAPQRPKRPSKASAATEYRTT